jgi:hypothetical protein
MICDIEEHEKPFSGTATKGSYSPESTLIIAGGAYEVRRGNISAQEV